jgi:MYXO-CTERM domain-containing protein
MKRVFALASASTLFLAGASVADTLHFNDFSGGLGGNESVDGLFSVNGGTVGHSGSYTNSEHSSYYLTLDFTGYTNLQLEFDITGSIENHFDGFNVVEEGVQVLVPTSGITYETQSAHFHTPFTTGGDLYWDASPQSGGHVIIDLSAHGYDGAGSTTMRFQFGSDTSVTFGGVNIDNVLVTGDLVPAPGALALLGMAGFAARRRRR